VGNPYVLGGSSLTNGIDCSNFVMRVYEAFGVSLPHHSTSLRNVGYEVSASEIQPGDIICYSGHVSIYIGNGQCVHASNEEDGIKVSPKWNYTKVITIRRIF
jgi:cell wall-associated NlpC family hydrolase